MKNYITYLSLFLLVLSTASCSDDDDGQCSPAIIAVTSLEDEYGCTNTPDQMEIDLTEDFIIISTQAQFDNLVTGSCTPDIDFVTYDLLIGKKQLSSGLEKITYDNLMGNCNNNELALNITFTQNIATIAPNVTYHLLVPKLQDGEVIIVSTTTII
ncbi:MAG: hypothetical protein WA775_02100 [Psychroserpens sp.]|uniref:hypothetical protein n=1 Tax=Psychroserpens sp. TaxID=2020870 RepID=UPI003C75949C